MILYHGTATPYLSSILENGMQCRPDNRWMAVSQKGINPSIDDKNETRAFAATFLEDAVAFSLLRSRYLRAEVGSWVKVDRLQIFRKLQGAPTFPEALPVVLKLSVPDSCVALDWHCYNAVKFPPALAVVKDHVILPFDYRQDRVPKLLEWHDLKDREIQRGRLQ